NRLVTEIAGRPIENEDLVNLPNWLPLTFRIEGGAWFALDQVEVLDYQQVLDLRKGVLTRAVRFRDGEGRHTRFTQRRFVHLADPHLAGLETSFVAEDWSGRLDVRSALDGTVTNWGVPRYRKLNGDHLAALETGTAGEDVIWLQVETRQSRIRVAEAARTRVYRHQAGEREAVTVERSVDAEAGFIAHQFSVGMEHGHAVSVEKIVTLFTSRDRAISESGLAARERVRHAGGFEDLLASHVRTWELTWQRFLLSIEGHDRAALVLNLHIFHLLVTVSDNTIGLDAGVPARGLHGEAYRGHIFWDELFIFPFLNLRDPELTRSLLLYRYRRLPRARLAAAKEGYAGAMYPWQSGSTGREESQLLHLNPKSGRWLPDASHLQRHINIAIAYNVWQYFQVTGDMDFMASYGAEMLLEIARFWSSISTWNPELERYEILKVMGPDEYHEGYPDTEMPGLDNNSYTNLMAVWVMCRALELLDALPLQTRRDLEQRFLLSAEEQRRWADVSRRMRVVFHADGIISQFEGYEDLAEFDWEGYRERYGDIQRLDRILEAEGESPNRYKLSKQADVLMLFYLLSAEELESLFNRLGYEFDHELIPSTIDYYLERTSHGSTLSRVVHSWVLARSDRVRSWDFFKDALESDISDIQGGTTAEGIHLGAMAGIVDLVQRSYTGLEIRGGVLYLNPLLPEELTSLECEIRFREIWRLRLHVSTDRMVVTASSAIDGPVTVGYRDKVVDLRKGDSYEFDLERWADSTVDSAAFHT
ncbi:MAG: glycoside hydrolase family 65 protein, partial [Nitriliruptorales bacterium]|nr:glycoside hydrolase family 65 protein [Nitriliruptorales bacterium]